MIALKYRRLENYVSKKKIIVHASQGKKKQRGFDAIHHQIYFTEAKIELERMSKSQSNFFVVVALAVHVHVMAYLVNPCEYMNISSRIYCSDMKIPVLLHTHTVNIAIF